MYIFWNLLVRIERSFDWSSGLLLFGQLGPYRFGHGFLVYAESERFKLAVTDMDGFDHAYSCLLDTSTHTRTQGVQGDSTAWQMLVGLVLRLQTAPDMQ